MYGKCRSRESESILLYLIQRDCFVDVVVTEVLCNTVIKMIRLLVSIVIIFSAHPVHSSDSVCDIPVSELLIETKESHQYFEQIPSQFLLIKSFYALQVCAPLRFEEYLATLPSVSEEDARILIYAAQSLKGNTYLQFGNGIVALINEGKVSSRLLEQFIFPGYDWNTMLVENFGDPKVVKLMNRAKKIIVSETVAIDEILTGESLLNLVNHRLNQALPN